MLHGCGWMMVQLSDVIKEVVKARQVPVHGPLKVMQKLLVGWLTLAPLMGKQERIRQ